jgi:DNA-binding protein YbaB
MGMMDKAKMAQKALKLQKELKRMKIEAEAGEGDVKVTAGLAIGQASMNVEIQAIEFSESVTDDTDRLERLLISAINQANKELMSEATAKMQEIAGDLNIAGM